MSDGRRSDGSSVWECVCARGVNVCDWRDVVSNGGEGDGSAVWECMRAVFMCVSLVEWGARRERGRR